MEIEIPSLSENALLDQLNDTSLNLDLRENFLLKLTEIYTRNQETNKIIGLIGYIKQLAPDDSKMYIARIMNQILTVVQQNDIPRKPVEIEVAQFILQECITEKKQFLINKMRLHVANVLYQREEFRKSKKELDFVLENAKDIDDKRLLVECFLLESKLIFESQNIPKAKASLTACRASANLVHISSTLQAEIEFTAGQIHLAEKDFGIAFSYFFESFEGFHQNKMTQEASKLFTYMILAKIMEDQLDEAENLLQGRFGQIYAQKTDFSILIQEITIAYKKKSLIELTKIQNAKKELIEKDRTIHSQIGFLYEQLLEKNILKLIKPYSKLQISFLGEKLQVDKNLVEKTLSRMILDSKLFGSMDQENGILIIMDKGELDPIYEDSLEILNNMDESMNVLFEKAKKIQFY